MRSIPRNSLKKDTIFSDENQIRFWLLMTKIAPGATMILLALAIVLRPDTSTGVVYYINSKLNLTPEFLSIWFLAFGVMMLIWTPQLDSNTLFTGGMYVLLTAPLLFFAVVGAWYPIFVNKTDPLTDAVAWIACYMFLSSIYFLSLSINDLYRRIKKQYADGSKKDD